MTMTGAQILLKALEREGVKHIFGFPGGAVIDLYDELSRCPHIKHYLVRHEQGAIHAADGYARAAATVGVCLVTSGPGATNTVSGIASAYMDSIPVVVFTGQVPTALIGNDAFQEVDIVGITRPCTKHNYLIKSVNDLARIVHEAFHIARSGRPGPVLVDLPKDVLAGRTTPKFPETIKIKSYNPTYHANPRQVKRALDLILKAQRPVIYAGGGVISSGAAEELTKLAESLQIPVTNTLMGLGGFPAPHDLWLGMLGMHGTYYANMAIHHCDVLIAIGARFDDRVTGKIEEFAPEAKIIHIDIDPTSISKNVVVDIPIVGDCKNALGQLNQLIAALEPRDWGAARQLWLDQIAVWKRDHPLTYDRHSGELKPQFVVEKLYELTKGEAIITTEVGQNQMWAAQFYLMKRPNRWMSSGGLGCMGYGFPAALGAQVACPNDLVIDIAGDGSIQMNIQEMATAVEYDLPVKVAILNNQYLGMVRQWQQLFYKGVYSQTSLQIAPDFVKLAEAYGGLGLRAEKPEEVEPVILEAINTRKPVLIDFRVAPEECVTPMVPAGAPTHKMILV
ncbi:MAG: biosynthetic-type acetolactate synthase large subunit [Deltaproteobacteria bacterium]|nr:biosynthetic-type acetolactate synthase large subunit [Deltaproteobacteria bacterium]MBW1951656.1 biosynthetic-type acetolactate synthase large subunit [Deltaproteobacteria bacterium]MBW1985756.1 biosynthetic-type acetolactate synthase large subunit [Deltaproteobacteria bacterium]MBW2134669.1 biosynthetic-type acetolactate synthase large subunit [Deltaproteobacteria bacterium]